MLVVFSPIPVFDVGAFFIAVILPEEIQHVLTDVGAIKAFKVQTTGEQQLPDSAAVARHDDPGAVFGDPQKGVEVGGQGFSAPALLLEKKDVPKGEKDKNAAACDLEKLAAIHLKTAGSLPEGDAGGVLCF